jgi:hypothetical protein
MWIAPKAYEHNSDPQMINTTYSTGHITEIYIVKTREFLKFLIFVTSIIITYIMIITININMGPY